MFKSRHFKNPKNQNVIISDHLLNTIGRISYFKEIKKWKMPQCKWRWSGFHHDSTAPIEFILEEVILTWLDLKMIFMILKMVLLSESFFLEWTNAGTLRLPMAKNSTINCNNFGCDPLPLSTMGLLCNHSPHGMIEVIVFTPNRLGLVLFEHLSKP